MEMDRLSSSRLSFADERIEQLKQFISVEQSVTRKTLEEDLKNLKQLPLDIQLDLISEVRMSYPTATW